MLQSMYFSSEAWLEAFLEHPLFLEYLVLAWTEVDAEQKLKFDYVNRKSGDGVASLCIALSKRKPIIAHEIHFFSEGALCDLMEFVSAISHDNSSGAINPFVAFMLDIEERAAFMLEVAQKQGDVARVRRVLAFEYSHFPFLSAELERLQVIRGDLYVSARSKATPR